MPLAESAPPNAAPERIETIIIGGGQARLSVGHQQARRGLPLVILDAGERIGDSWRCQWDSPALTLCSEPTAPDRVLEPRGGR